MVWIPSCCFTANLCADAAAPIISYSGAAIARMLYFMRALQQTAALFLFGVHPHKVFDFLF